MKEAIQKKKKEIKKKVLSKICRYKKNTYLCTAIERDSDKKQNKKMVR